MEQCGPFGIVRDASGRIVHPTGPDVLKTALEIEDTWDLFHETDDESKLIEIGLFPNPDED